MRAREDDGQADVAAATPSPPSADLFRSGHPDDRLRRALARLRRSRDPKVRAAGEEIAAEAAAALLALAERASQADPVTRRRLAQAAARTARLTAQVDNLIAVREVRS
ncbi:hypothetical protein [Pseudonocardia hydrocarbonoxydans]|uniref:hypothetical protein n=1 Tax=Pseudonocardia hydrocarbonoxydans TaxID=76726 RepID=UPI001144BFC5|nr:hypothetical protein [Pseudonocardia hydrocarbonoxydans]